MSAASITLRGRIAAEALMVDACVVTRKTGETTNTDTAAVTPVIATLYTGKCRVQIMATGHVREQDVGESYILLLRIDVHLPMSVTGLATEDLITITASALDPDLVGRKFRIRYLSHKTHMTARRLRAEEVT